MVSVFRVRGLRVWGGGGGGDRKGIRTIGAGLRLWLGFDWC